MRIFWVMAVAALTLAGCRKGGLEGDGIFHGNVEDRDLRLSFVQAERVATIVPEEGAVVKKAI